MTAPHPADLHSANDPRSADESRLPPGRVSTCARRLADYGTVLGIVGVAVVCGWIVLWASGEWGLGLSSDSLGYFIGAQSLAEGRGYYHGGTKLTHHPPGYSAVLAAVLALADVPPPSTARLLNALLFPTTIVSVGLLVWRYAGRTGSLLAAMLVALHSDLWKVHLLAGPEPLAIAVGMGGLWWLLLYAERPRAWLALLAGLAISAGCLIRYAGWFWLPVACAAIAVARPGLARGLRDAAILATITVIPNLLWMYRCGSVRRIAWHPPPREKVLGGFDALDHWDMSVVLWALLVAAVVLAHRALWKPVVLLVAAVTSYALLLALALLLFDALVPLNWRMLSPAAPIVIVLVSMGMRAVPDGLRRFRPRGRRVPEQVVATAVVLALLPWNDWWRGTRRTVDTFRANGGGLMLLGNAGSPTLAAIAELPGSTGSGRTTRRRSGWPRGSGPTGCRGSTTPSRSTRARSSSRRWRRWSGRSPGVAGSSCGATQTGGRHSCRVRTRWRHSLANTGYGDSRTASSGGGPARRLRPLARQPVARPDLHPRPRPRPVRVAIPTADDRAGIGRAFFRLTLSDHVVDFPTRSADARVRVATDRVTRRQ